MRHAAVSFMILLVIVGGCRRPTENADQAIEENKKLDARFFEAYRAKDIDGIMSCLWNSPDVIAIPFDNIEGNRGWQAIRKAMTFSLNGLDKITGIHLVDPEYFYYGEAVVGSGIVVFKALPKGSPEEIEITTRYTDIRQRKDGRWLYVYSHASISPLSTAGIPVASSR